MSTNTPSCIAVDCRMLGMSGIGVYIENTVPQLVSELSNCKFRLIGDEDKLKKLPLPKDSLETGRVSFYPCQARIYSIKEQFLLPLADRVGGRSPLSHHRPYGSVGQSFDCFFGGFQ